MADHHRLPLLKRVDMRARRTSSPRNPCGCRARQRAFSRRRARTPRSDADRRSRARNRQDGPRHPPLRGARPPLARRSLQGPLPPLRARRAGAHPLDWQAPGDGLQPRRHPDHRPRLGARRERARRDEADARGLRAQARGDARRRCAGSRRSQHELEASLDYLDTCDVCDPQRLLSACNCCDLHDKEVARARARRSGSERATRTHRRYPIEPEASD